MPDCILVALLDIKGYDCIKRVYSVGGSSPTIPTLAGGGHTPKVMLMDGKVRKLTEWECLKLQGYTEEEASRLKVFDEGNKPLFSMTNVFKFAGNSVAVNCYTAILSQIVEDIE